jgi:glycosyltransferase involved in cell wall biosynthesis
MNIAHIVPYIGDEASGPAYSVPALCQALHRNGCSVTLYTLNPLPKKDKFEFEVKSFKRSNFPLYSFGRSRPKYQALLNDSANIDIIHNHSFWMASNIYAGFVAKNSKIPLVNSPRGTFSDKALSRSKWKKRIVSLFGQKAALNNTSCFHVTSSHEVSDTNKVKPNTPIAQIPNGIDVPQLASITSLNLKRKKLLFLGRLHQIKGIENLIEAWGQLEALFPDWDCEIVGVGKLDYVESLKSIIVSMGLDRIRISDAVYGEEKVKKFQEADLYVLPSFSENFGMTVAESLVNNTPVITTDRTPWQKLDIKNAGWCIGVGVQPLVNVLNLALLKNKEELFDMGVRGRIWMITDFSWEKIAQDMIALYKWLLKTGKKPKCVKYE